MLLCMLDTRVKAGCDLTVRQLCRGECVCSSDLEPLDAFGGVFQDYHGAGEG